MISSLSFVHSPEHPKRFTELGREEKRRGGDRGDLQEKKESQKQEIEVTRRKEGESKGERPI